MNRRTVPGRGRGSRPAGPRGAPAPEGSTKGADAAAPYDPSKVSGTIKVLTVRTDLVQDGTLKKYAAEFRKTYPKVKVEFEGITDYEAEVKIRMNAEELR